MASPSSAPASSVSRRPEPLVRGWIATFRDRCRTRGIRLTPQRLAIYESLARDTTHPSAEALFRRLKKRFSTLSLGTVYRTLEVFERQGLLRRVNHSEANARFDGNLEPHQHLQCRVCGEIQDVAIAELTELRPPPSPIPGFRVEGFDIHLVGRCARCVG